MPVGHSGNGGRELFSFVFTFQIITNRPHNSLCATQRFYQTRRTRRWSVVAALR